MASKLLFRSFCYLLLSTNVLAAPSGYNVKRVDNTAGIGVELEWRGVTMLNDNAALKPPSDVDELVKKIKGSKLIIQDGSEAKNGVGPWVVTAEHFGSEDTLGVSKIVPEFIVDGLSVKIGDGKLKGIGEDIISFLNLWLPSAAHQSAVQVTGLEEFGTWKVIEPVNEMTKVNIDSISFGVQVTAPMPLAGILSCFQTAKDDEKELNIKPDCGPLLPFARSLKANMHLVGASHIDISFKKEGSVDLSPNTLGFLSLVVSYAKAAANGKVNAEKGIKHTIPIMPRTDFGTMYNRFVEADLKKNLKTNWCGYSLYKLVKSLSEYDGDGTDSKDRRFSSAKLDTESIKWKNGLETRDLKIATWLDLLETQGGDKMTDYDRTIDGQIGGLGNRMETLYGSPFVSAPIFEFRDLSILSSRLPGLLQVAEDTLKAIHEKFNSPPLKLRVRADAKSTSKTCNRSSSSSSASTSSAATTNSATSSGKSTGSSTGSASETSKSASLTNSASKTSTELSTSETGPSSSFSGISKTSSVISTDSSTGSTKSSSLTNSASSTGSASETSKSSLSSASASKTSLSETTKSDSSASASKTSSLSETAKSDSSASVSKTSSLSETTKSDSSASASKTSSLSETTKSDSSASASKTSSSETTKSDSSASTSKTSLSETTKSDSSASASKPSDGVPTSSKSGNAAETSKSVVSTSSVSKTSDGDSTSASSTAVSTSNTETKTSSNSADTTSKPTNTRSEISNSASASRDGTKTNESSAPSATSCPKGKTSSADGKRCISEPDADTKGKCPDGKILDPAEGGQTKNTENPVCSDQPDCADDEAPSRLVPLKKPTGRGKFNCVKKPTGGPLCSSSQFLSYEDDGHGNGKAECKDTRQTKKKAAEEEERKQKAAEEEEKKKKAAEEEEEKKKAAEEEEKKKKAAEEEERKKQEAKDKEAKDKKNKRANFCMAFVATSQILEPDEIPGTDDINDAMDAAWPGDMEFKGDDLIPSNIEHGHRHITYIEPGQSGGSEIETAGINPGAIFKAMMGLEDAAAYAKVGAKAGALSASRLASTVERYSVKAGRIGNKAAESIKKIKENSSFLDCLSAIPTLVLDNSLHVGDDVPQGGFAAQKSNAYVHLWKNEDGGKNNAEAPYSRQAYDDEFFHGDRLVNGKCYNLEAEWQDSVTAFDAGNTCCTFYRDGDCKGAMFAGDSRQDGELTGKENDSMSSYMCTENHGCGAHPT